MGVCRMIKGINRQMIEVTDTGNPYFERAFFVVRQHCRDTSASLLDHEAHCALNAADGYSGLRRAGWLRTLCKWGLFLLGVTLGALCMYGFLVL